MMVFKRQNSCIIYVMINAKAGFPLGGILRADGGADFYFAL
jgi:hypothetical protein